jgi:hypothetical protein
VCVCVAVRVFNVVLLCVVVNNQGVALVHLLSGSGIVPDSALKPIETVNNL